jgi:hypothetical protein
MNGSFVVESLDELEPTAGAWVYLRGEHGGLYVARDGKWVRHEKPAEPDLWSYLTDDSEP